MRYRFRWFNSKGAALVLFWMFLMSAALSVLPIFVRSPFYKRTSREWIQLDVVVNLGFITFLSAPFFGWLADAKLGNYRVIKIGLISSFIASVLNSTYLLLINIQSLAELILTALKIMFATTVVVGGMIGVVIAAVNLIQLGLEQLQDGSAEELASLISWMVFALFAGVWSGDQLFSNLLRWCIPHRYTYTLYQVLSLLPVLMMSIALSSYYILSPKWLIIEPKTPQSLKNIFRVLRFAAKHKAPLNRSALTYWEEDIPSRLDLGKSRFGGPFTTEQVEDVKTFFRLFVVGIPLLLAMLGSTLNVGHLIVYSPSNISGLSPCECSALELFTFNRWWCGMVTVVVYEFLIYPCINYRLPSLMKRIGFFMFVQLLQNSTLLVLSVLAYFSYIDGESLWLLRINSMLYGVLIAALVLSCFEFVCAQSPYNMRGLMTGCLLLLVIVAVSLQGNHIAKMLKLSGYPCVLPSVATAVSLFAFILYLIIAQWYKMRVRDNDYSPHMHRVVEEVYERTISANVADRRSHGFND